MDRLIAYLRDIAQAWSDFQGLPYAHTMLVVAGALLVLLAVVRIVGNSLPMLLWVVLGGVGLALLLHGSGRAPWEPRGVAGVELEELVGPGREYSRDVLELLCIKLDESRGVRRTLHEPGVNGM